MKPFWIETGNQLRLAIVLRPRGGRGLANDLLLMKQAGVDVLVSTLPANEAAELGLGDEATGCQRAGMSYLSYPIPDRKTPSSTSSFTAFVDQLRSELHAGRSVAVHCRASIGRSSLLLAAVLCAEGMTAQKAFKCLTVARGMQVPDTREQVRWIERYVTTIEPDST
jgi:protein-tyrosine phosphatase